MADEEQKPTNPLSALINGRSEALLAPTVDSPHVPVHSPQPGETEEATRRRKLLLSPAPIAEAQDASSQSGKKRLLAPETSSPVQPAGGFLLPGEGAPSTLAPSPATLRPPATSASRLDPNDDVLGTHKLHHGGITNGTTVLTAQAPSAEDEQSRPRKKLMRASDLEARGSRDSSLGAEDATSPGVSATASPVTSPANDTPISGRSTPSVGGVGTNLQHVHLNRTSSGVGSQTSLHGPSGLSNASLPNAATVQAPQPQTNRAATKASAIHDDDESSPVVGKRRRKTTKRIMQDEDDDDSDYKDTEHGDDEDEDDYVPEDEEKPSRSSATPRIADAAAVAFGSKPVASAHGSTTAQSYSGTAYIPQQFTGTLMPGGYASSTGTSPIPSPFSQPAYASSSQMRGAASAAQNAHEAEERFLRFRKGCFPTMPEALVREAWQKNRGDIQEATKWLHANPRSIAPPPQWTVSSHGNATYGPQASPPYTSGYGASGVNPGQRAGPFGSHVNVQHGYGSGSSGTPYSLPSQAPLSGHYHPQQSSASPNRSSAGSPQSPNSITMPPLSASQVQWLFVNIKPKLPPELQHKLTTMAAQQQLAMLYTFYQTQQRAVQLSKHATQNASPQYAQFQQGQQQQHHQTMPQAQQTQRSMLVGGRALHPFASQQAAHRSGSSALQQAQLAQQQQQFTFKKKKRVVDSDDSDAGYSDEEGGRDRYFERERGAKEIEALAFFNTRAAQELQDLTACTNQQIKLVMDMRPFASVEDVRVKLKKTKGISANLFDNFVDIMQAYSAVDKVFENCRQVGIQLDEIMSIWKTVSGNQPGIAISSGTGIGTATPAEGEPDESAGTHLTAIDENAIKATLERHGHSDAVKDAFAGYLRSQPAGIPDSIKLKAYQMLGVNWLYLLYRKGHSCILADEMGLGKTCQIIAFLSHLKAIGEKGPHLIIVPSSTLENWLREFMIFAPDLRVASYYGTQRERDELRDDIKESLRAGETDVVVTTYNLASGTSDDRKFLRKCRFKTCTYDEGHQLKNSESKKHRDLMSIDVPWRVLLTGTPLQNNLTELISLLAFILPEIIGAAQDELRAIFKVPVGAQSSVLSKHRINSAKSIMTPFVLRRKKLQVLQDLPSKTARIEYCEMTDLQRNVYEEAVARSKRALLETVETRDVEDETIADAVAEEEAEENKEVKQAKAKQDQDQSGKRGFTKKGVLRVQAHSAANVLMDLRKAANHPMLFRRLYDDKKIRQMSKDCLKEPEFSDRNANLIYEDMDVMTDFELHRFVQPYAKLREKYSLKESEWMNSGKVDALKRLLPKYLEDGQRVLLFSQFTQVLDILEAVLDTMGIRWLKLTGQTSVIDRQGIVDEFYADESIGVFLLSTRAGGLGLNLAAANIVILHDQDFNPHNDRQAEDRAWRIGQTREVQVIRLICKKTIDEEIFELAQTKLLLDREVTMDVTSGEVPLEETPSEPTNITAASLAGPKAKKSAGKKGKSTAAGAGGADGLSGVGEGDEASVAKRMSKSILSRLRDQYENEDKKPVEPDGLGTEGLAPTDGATAAKTDESEETRKAADAASTAPDAKMREA